MLVIHGLVFFGLLVLAFVKNVSIGDGISIRSPIRAVLLVVLSLVYMFAVTPAFGQIESGHQGVVLHFGAPTGQVLDEGLYFLPPFVYSVIPMSMQTQVYVAKALEAASHDLQVVHTDVVLNYRVDPSKIVDIYRYYRHDIETRVLAPAVQEVVKASTARFSAEKLVTERATVKQSMDAALDERMDRVGLVLENANITNFDFDPEFQKTIEAKQVAEQQIQVERNKLAQIEVQTQRQVAEATARATAAMKEADGRAYATRVEAEANALAIRQRAEALQANQKLVELEAVQRWDGKLPPYNFSGSNGSAVLPIINIPSVVQGR